MRTLQAGLATLAPLRSLRPLVCTQQGHGHRMDAGPARRQPTPAPQHAGLHPLRPGRCLVHFYDPALRRGDLAQDLVGTADDQTLRQ